MEVLGVGPTELLLIVAIALIVLGPKDLAKTGKTVGKWLNSIVHSDAWKAIRKTSDELKQLPTQLMREENFEKHLQERQQEEQTQTPQAPARKDVGTWAGNARLTTAPPPSDPEPASENENTIHPPITVDGPPPDTLTVEPKKAAAASTPRKKTTTNKKSPVAKKTTGTVKKPAAKKSTGTTKKSTKTSRKKADA